MRNATTIPASESSPCPCGGIGPHCHIVKVGWPEIIKIPMYLRSTVAVLSDIVNGVIPTDFQQYRAYRLSLQWLSEDLVNRTLIPGYYDSDV